MTETNKNAKQSEEKLLEYCKYRKTGHLGHITKKRDSTIKIGLVTLV